MKTQTEQIRTHLENGNTITPLGALRKFKCFRLASRVSELRKAGMNIKTDFITKNGKTYANYKIGKTNV